MIYYTTLSLTPAPGHEAQGIDEAIAQGLNDLSGEAGQLVLLEDVITTPIAGEHPVVCVTVLAKPLKAEALTINEVRKGYGLDEIDVPYGSTALQEAHENDRSS